LFDAEHAAAQQFDLAKIGIEIPIEPDPKSLPHQFNTNFGPQGTLPVTRAEAVLYAQLFLMSVM
jgi:hypothetical protein